MPRKEEKKEVADKQHKSTKSPHLVKYQWKKGQSGNPKGRPKNPSIREALGDDNVKELLQKYIERARKSDRVLTHAIDQIHGKANQSMDIQVKESISDLLNELDNDTKEEPSK